MAKIKVGDRFESNNCGWSEVIEYNNPKNITVKFIETGYVTNVQGGNLRSGQVYDKLYPTTLDRGFLGDGPRKPREEAKPAKSYRCWKDMLKRCYSEESQEKFPTYKGCSVDEEWYNFQTFAKYYKDNYKEGYHLDKDLLFKGNKVYSPDTCVFVPSHLNSFILGRGASRGKYKIGVTLMKGSKSKPYESRISNTINGKQIHLGRFPTEQLAYEAWLTAKLQQALAYKPDMDEIDKRIYPNVVEIIKEM